MEIDYYAFKDREICMCSLGSSKYLLVVGAILKHHGMLLLGGQIEPLWLQVSVYMGSLLASQTSLLDISIYCLIHQVMNSRSKYRAQR